MERSRLSRRCLALTVVMAAFGLIASGSSPARAAAGRGHGAQFRLAWLANDPNNAYDNAILAGIESVAVRSQSSVDAFFAGFDPATQLGQCLDAVSSGSYDGLIIIAASPIEIIPCVEAAHAAGIPVAAVDLVIGPEQTTVEPQVEGIVAASYVTAADWGAAVTEIVPEACAGLDPCDVFYLAGVSAFPSDQFGYAAVQAVAAASPTISSAGTAEAFYDAGFAYLVMTQVFAEHPEIDVVITSDQMAVGTEQAAAEAGVTVRLVGAGAGASAIDAVRDGRWFATATFLPFTEGRIVTDLLVRALRVRPFEPAGVDPVAASGLPVWLTEATLATLPDFEGEWPGP